MSAFIYNNKTINNVLIVGYGITGKSIHSYLNQFSLDISISDNVDDFTSQDLQSYDLIAVSPGIPLNREPYSVLKSFGNITSDIDLFYNHISSKNIKMIGITGSNGKSTIVTMLDYVLTNIGKKSILVGNIGTPILSQVNEGFEYCVVELSSFQIDLLKIAKFDVACVINISQDHLDRYNDFAEYIQSKLNLEKFTKDFFIYDFEESGLKYTGDFSIDNQVIYCDKTKLINLSETKLSGSYNLDNIAVVLSILAELDLDVVKAINAIKTFKGLKHRCNNLGQINGVTYINDSKGTNVGATQAAIDSLANGKNVVLLLGGVAKGGDFTIMAPSIEKYVKYISVYGRDADFIIGQLPNGVDITKSQSMPEAVDKAIGYANSTDVVLFSPACASFDEFRSYEHRGDEFEKIFNNLKIKKG